MADQDESNSTDPTGDNEPAAAGQDQQPDIAAIIAKTVAEEMAKVRDGLQSALRGQVRDQVRKHVGKQESVTTPPPAQSQPDDGRLAKLEQELESMRLEKAFDAVLATRPDIGHQRARELKEMFAVLKPHDPIAWLNDKAPAPSSPSQSNPAPRTGSRTEAGSNPVDWTREEFQREFEREAPNPANLWDPANRPWIQKIRKQAEARLRTMRVKLQDDRGK